MKAQTKTILVSLLLGLVLTLGIGGLKYTFEKPGFDPYAGCQTQRCESHPYLGIGYPWRFGAYDHNNNSVTILSPTDVPSLAAPELIPRYFKGFAYDIALYAVVVFALLVLGSRLRKKTRLKDN
jgi:hypothetical protein